MKKRRYRYWKKQLKSKEFGYNNIFIPRFSVTMITTNLGEQEISKTYGHRVLDRIYEQYTILKFTNKSFRQQKAKILQG